MALNEILVFKLFRAEADTGTVTTPAIVISINSVARIIEEFDVDN